VRFGWGYTGGAWLWLRAEAIPRRGFGCGATAGARRRCTAVGGGGGDRVEAHRDAKRTAREDLVFKQPWRELTIAR